MVKPGMMVILYVDDQGIAAKNKDNATELIRRLRTVHGFELTEEGSFHEFLGLRSQRTKRPENVHDSQ